jgi:hypothetical protein
VNRSDWGNKYLIAAVLLQLVGYAALSALVLHGDFATAVEPLQRLPAVLLVLVALIAVPAVFIAIALGALLAVVGPRPTIALVLVGAYLVSIADLGATDE